MDRSPWWIPVAIILCLAAGWVGSIFTQTGEGSWYASLEKPAFNPPNWVFGPVWTALYVMMGVSLWLAWSAGVGKLPLSVFGAQLALNTLWSVIFFGMESPVLASAEIVILLIAILSTIILFHRRSKAAAYLLVPYLLWVGFASVLTFAIAAMN